jgi:hypothetical protein
MPPRLRRSLRPLCWLVAGWFVGCGGTPSNAGYGYAASDTPAGPASDAGGGAPAESEPTVPPIDANAGGDRRSSIDANTDAKTEDATSAGSNLTPFNDGAVPPPLYIADAAPDRAASNCKPGTYTGMFDVMVTTNGMAIGVDLQGTLSITLVASKPTPQASEFNSNILTVAPGAMLSATDNNYGDTWTADVSGQLDCGSLMFVGTLSNGMAMWAGISFRLDGSLSATYDPTANPPAMVNGSVDVSSLDVQGTEGMGTWSAALQ